MSIKTSYLTLVETLKEFRVIEKQYNEAKRVVEQMKEDLLKDMNEVGTETYKSDLATVSVIKSEVPTVKDWDAFYQYMMAHNAPDLLQRRVSQSAWLERVQEGEEIPGVEIFHKETLRVTIKK